MERKEVNMKIHQTDKGLYLIVEPKYDSIVETASIWLENMFLSNNEEVVEIIKEKTKKLIDEIQKMEQEYNNAKELLEKIYKELSKKLNVKITISYNDFAYSLSRILNNVMVNIVNENGQDYMIIIRDNNNISITLKRIPLKKSLSFEAGKNGNENKNKLRNIFNQIGNVMENNKNDRNKRKYYTPVSISIDSNLVEKMNEYISKHGLSRSRFVEKVLKEFFRAVESDLD